MILSTVTFSLWGFFKMYSYIIFYLIKFMYNEHSKNRHIKDYITSILCTNIFNQAKKLGHWAGERNVLFNDALNTFYLRLYGVRHMVKDHSDSEKGNPLPPHLLLLSINSKGSCICTIPQTG